MIDLCFCLTFLGGSLVCFAIHWEFHGGTFDWLCQCFVLDRCVVKRVNFVMGFVFT